MKKIFYLVSLAFLLACCSSDSDILKDQTLTISAVLNKSTVSIDEIFDVDITSKEGFSEIYYSFDGNFDNGGAIGFGTTASITSLKLKVKLAVAGPQTIYIKALKNRITNGYLDGNIESNVVTVTANANKENCVKITGLQLKSFHRINEAWDWFPESDPDRLADVSFMLHKLNEEYVDFEDISKLKYQSSVKQNQGDLIWEFASEDLYVNQNENLGLQIIDIDDNGNFQDLTPSSMYNERPFNLAAYASTKPSSVTVTLSNPYVPEDVVEFVLQLEWP